MEIRDDVSSQEAESRWIHNFYREHGGVIENLRNSGVRNVLEFGTDPEMFTEPKRA